MMIKHIVMWKLADSAEGFSKEDNAKRIKVELEKLKGKIAEVSFLEVGLNVNPADAAYDIVLYSEFESREALDAYQVHPDHVKFKEFIGKLRTERVVTDYEV